jgi:H+/Cl- antiporter ClcA
LFLRRFVLPYRKTTLRAVSRAARTPRSLTSSEAIAATVLSALVSALVIQQALGQELALQPGKYTSDTSLVQLPLYVGLGILSGGVALLFKQASATSRAVFNRLGMTGDATGAGQDGWRLLALTGRPVLGGLACGLVGVAFPQVLFFGYSTLDAILATGDTAMGIGSIAAADVPPLGPGSSMSLESQLSSGLATTERLRNVGGLELLDLLFAKLLATSLCVGAGLVGGTFAPSLFFGAVLGVCYQSIAGDVLARLADAIAAYQTSIGVPVGSWGVIPQLSVADAPAYAIIGAAAVLASVFRAPLTASLLLFELTRGYDIVLPLLAAAGTGPLVVEFATRSARADDAIGAEQRASSAAQLQVPDECTELSDDACKAEAYVALPDDCDIDNGILCESKAVEQALPNAGGAGGKRREV